MKNDYAISKNIPLIRIKQKNFKNISNILQEKLFLGRR